MSTPRWLAAAVSLALVAYPRAFRRRFGDELKRDTIRTLDTSGTLGTFGTLFLSGLAERWSAIVRYWSWSTTTPHLYPPAGRHAMFWDTLRLDLRYAVRLALKTPAFSLLAVLALALGIGANSAIFTVVSGVLLRSLPYQAPDRLMMVWSDNTREGRPQYPMSPANYADLRDSVREVVTLTAFQSFITTNRLMTETVTETLHQVSVEPQMFGMLGRDAILGRAFTPDDTDTVLLSHGYWQRRFGGDQTILGRALNIDGASRTVIGVMPDDFVFPYQTMLGPDGFTRETGVDAWVPLHLATDPFANRGAGLVRDVHYLAVIGRLQDGVGEDEARAALNGVARQLEQAYPDTNRGIGTTVIPLHEQTVGNVRPALLVLLAGVGVVLLMACVNVANLMLARSLGRQRELAVRVALGAGRARLVVQSLVESLVLSAAGALIALLFVQWLVQGLVAIAPATLPRMHELRPDLTIVAFTAGIAALVGMLVGIVPALAASTPDVRLALQDTGRGTTGSPARRRMRNALVITEVALAVVLTVGAGLLMRSFSTLLAVDPGFRPENLLTLQMTLPDRLTSPEARQAFYDQMFERLEAVPGVTAVGGTTRLPLGSTSVTTTVVAEGRDVPPGEAPEVQFRRALHDYFEAMGIPLIRGRGFTNADAPGTPPVIVINETMARLVFGGEDPVGKRLRTGPSPTAAWLTVVGVIGDIHHTGLEHAPEPELYMPARQGPPVSPFLVLRTTGDPGALASSIRADLRQLDAGLAVFDIRNMEDVRTESMAARRFLLLLVSVFGALALTLAAVGVYGVMTLVVAERTAELGLRLALGAQPSAALRLVGLQAVTLAGTGVAIGLGLAYLLSPLLASQLFGITAHDPISLVGAPTFLLLTALLAALIPARKAMQVDVMEALR
ncbi:MAG: ABC transporter permease [Vicinamibacterales bacterium]|nr:ABC transporter permease [Vicinamibacterales bacterium]